MDGNRSGATSGNSEHVGTLRDIVASHGREMVAGFYETLMRNEDAARFLSHSVVHNRLSASLQSWLAELLDEADIRESTTLQGRQKAVGEVHARIKIPIHLVMEGAMVIKSHLARLVMERPLDGRAAIETIQLASDRIDTAILLMSKAYVKDATDRARLDEAYRLFSLDQDVAIEKEAQRACLMEWGQKTLFALLRGGEAGGLSRLSDSPFGLWVRHRASFMFEKSPIHLELTAAMTTIDSELLPELDGRAPASKAEVLAAFQAAVDRIAFLLSELFQTLAAMENGRDPLTRALNRRFLPAILGREISFASESGRPLSIILMDIDHFKAVNDRHGHQTGDLVLRQVAQVILECVRPSDFIFRYGGEEFLILLAESDVGQAREIAERIRTELRVRELDTGTAEALTTTASFGIAAYAGHPDQQYLIKAADDALYRAKANGRDRVEIGQPG